MLDGKSTKVLKEINSFFSSNENGIDRVLDIFTALKLNSLDIGKTSAPQKMYQKDDILYALLLFPLLRIANVYSYRLHVFSEKFEAKKNTFYRFKNDVFINWRNLHSNCNKQIFKKIESRATIESRPKCLIVDDTDFEKQTYKTEHVGRIWSHVSMKSILGYKGLFLGYFDGCSYFNLDFSLHKEKGKNKKRPYGLTKKQNKAQFKKKRDNKSPSKIREKELKSSKISQAISMINRSLKTVTQVDYVLLDSWFFCEEILKYLRYHKTPMHLIAMAKMGKAKFTYRSGEFSAKELAQMCKRSKKVRRQKDLNLYVATIDVDYKGVPLRLFFCKNSKRGKWHLLTSTDLNLEIKEAYEIYSIRWCIEVFFKEAKQYLHLGKSHSQDFDAQIADITIACMQYNILSVVKRVEKYECIGGLFAEIQDKTTEYTMALRIWKFILELLEIICELIDEDINELIVKLMKIEKKQNQVINLMKIQFENAS